MWVIAAASLQRGQTASAAQMIVGVAEGGVALGDAAQFFQRVGREGGDGDAGFFGFSPEPVDRTVAHPPRIVQKCIPQTEHAGLPRQLAMRARDPG